MKSKVFTIAIGLFMACVGGFVGYSPNSPSQTVQASTMIRWIDVPKPNFSYNVLQGGRSIEVDLQNETVSLNGNVDNTTVTIKKDVETRPEYITKIVHDTTYINVENMCSRTKLFNRLHPIDREMPSLAWHTLKRKATVTRN